MSTQTQAHRLAKTRTAAGERREVLQIARCVSATLGTDFFQSVVKHLATALHADCAYLAELAGSPTDRIRTVAVFALNGASEDFEQKLSGTAAAQVLADGVFATTKDVTRIFPEDDHLTAMHAQGFWGVRLSDSVGQPLGLLALISERAFPNIRLLKTVAEAFVPRAAAELERKKADEILKENEERYHAFIVTNPDAMWRIEFEQPIPLSLSEEEQIGRIFRYGFVAECNSAFAKLAGRKSVDELVGVRLEVIFPRTGRNVEEFRSMIRSGFCSTAKEVRPIDESGRMSYRLRSHFGIVEEGRLRRLWGTTRDITDLRRAEISLEAAERRFREVLEGIQLPAIILDRNGAVSFSNRCFLDLTQLAKNDLSALSWLDGMIPASETETWKASLLAGSDAASHFEGTVISRDGSPHTVEWDTIGLRDHANRVAALAAIGRDVSHQRALETEIRQAQKLEGIGRLAAGLAHDFNNLLTVMLGHTSQLQTSIPESDPARKRLDAIEQAITNCTLLTGQLSAVARKQRLRAKSVDLNGLIAECEPILRGLVGQGIQLTLDLPSPLPSVFVDSTQILRVLTNLVSNATDAMPHGGTLTIATSPVLVGAGNTTHPGAQAGPYVQLSISDTGVGMTEEVKARIFEPFFTSKTPGKGTGLGLFTVYGIVTQSSGHIAVRSQPGEGAVFEIILPVAVPANQPR